MNNSTKISDNEQFKRKVSEVSNKLATQYIKLHNQYVNMPYITRLLNITLVVGLTLYFTYVNYNIWASIIFSIISFIVIFLIGNVFAAFGFLVIYITIIINITNKRKQTFGNPILQTDILQNGKPFSCLANSLTIKNNTFQQDLNGGYFTYSFWLYINGTNQQDNWYTYRYNEWKSIFYRGTQIEVNKDNVQTDIAGLVQYPGFWLTPKINNLVIVFQNAGYVERLEINNIELNKWTNIVVVVEYKSVSIYINGLLDRTLNLSQNVLNMSNYNLYIGGDKGISETLKQSGFAGDIAELIYYNYALNYSDIINSYNYYKKIIDNYQNKLINKNFNYTISKNTLITNNNYYS